MRGPRFGRLIVAAVVLVVAVVMAACAPSGRLIVIGGGLRPDNARVLRRFVALARPRGPITIVATASADPPAARLDSRALLGRHAPAAELLDWLDPGPAAAAPAAQLRRSGGLFFTGGDQSRITARFRGPAGEESPELSALRALLARGGVIAGTSAGAAALSDPMFTGGDSETALGRGPELGRGLGLFPYGPTDSHFFSRGRLGRLVAALAQGAGRYGLGVADDRGVEVELRRGRLTALGDHAALLVDGTGLRCERGAGVTTCRGARITLLSDGDEVDLRRGVVRPAAGLRLVAARRSTATATATATLDGARPPAWGADVVIERLAALARGGTAVAAASPAVVLWLRADEQTRFVFAADGRLRTAAQVIVDLVVRPPP